MKDIKIPEATIARLSVYSRYLTKLEAEGVQTISSNEIATGIAGNSAQVRKDFAYFGGFGKRGVGYNVVDLNYNIKEILGLHKDWKAVIIGMGNLGTAIAHYHGFAARGFNVIGLFDNDGKKVGEEVNGLPIQSMDQLEPFLSKNQVDIAVVTVPAEHVQKVVNLVSSKGVKGVLNFAPTVVFANPGTQVRNVDLSVNLEILSYNLNTMTQEQK